jgi:outer membrane receptor for ferrienterochelin and colicins
MPVGQRALCNRHADELGTASLGVSKTSSCESRRASPTHAATRRRLLAGFGRVVFAFAGWVAASRAGVARADTDGTSSSNLEMLLEENVVTTVSKSAETSTVAPATSTSITAEELRTHGIRSLDEAIDFLSLGVVTANPLRDPDIGARGVLITGDRGNHLLLLLNGHAVNEPLYGSAQFGRGAGIPMELIDHVEVIIGPGSVLYGSNAMFGVINVITKRAKDFGGMHAIVETEVGKSYRAAAGAGYRLGASSEITLGVEYYEQRGPTFTFGPQFFGKDLVGNQLVVTRRNGPPDGLWGGKASHSNFAMVPSGFLQLKSGDLELNLHASTYKRGAPYAAFLTPMPGDFDDATNHDLDRSLWGDIRYSKRFSPTVHISSRVYGDGFDNQRTFIYSTAAGCFYGDKSPCLYHWAGRSQWVGAELQGSFNWLGDSTLQTLIGVDARLIAVSAKQDVQNADTLAYRASSSNVIDANERVVGAYLQQVWSPIPAFTLNAGARADASVRYDPVLSPRLAASIGAWTDGTVKAIYAEAFRAPSWNEAASKSLAVLLAEGLRPERVRSIEGVLEQKLGRQRVLFGVFRSWWTDLIDLHRLTPTEYDDFSARGKLDSLLNFSPSQFRNVDSIDNYGFNMRVEGTAFGTPFRYALNATAAYSRQTDPEYGASHPPTVTPQQFGNARISYDFGGPYPTIALDTQYLARRPTARAYEGIFLKPTHADAQLRLRATASGKVPLIQGVSYRLSADYAVTDRAAYIAGRPVDLSGGLATIAPELVPVDRFRIAIGLQYDFLR